MTIQSLPLLLLVHLMLSSTSTAQWSDQSSGTKARLRGLSVVSDQVAWASGAGATIVRTIDGGKHWEPHVIDAVSTLDFRDIHAVDADTAYFLSIGPGESSRILKTTDALATWTTLYRNPDPKGFLDAIAFADPDHGLAFGDPVGGRFVVLSTENSGKMWNPTPPPRMPLALPGEGAFAASGTCLTVRPDGHAWFATGGAKVSRVFRSTDSGRTWIAHETPINAESPSSGIFSLAFHDANHGVAVGGDYKEPARDGKRIALTSDGGRTWRIPVGPQPAGFRSSVAYVPGTKGQTLVVVGPTGTDLSEDGGERWRSFGTTGFHTVAFSPTGAGWAVGEDGRIAKFLGPPRP